MIFTFSGVKEQYDKQYTLKMYFMSKVKS